MLPILVTPEAAIDRPLIREVVDAAFGRPDEARIVDRLRDEGHALLSLVARLNGEVVGHVLFSRLHIERDNGHVKAVALAPLAVKPLEQGQGVGDCLVERGIEDLRAMGEHIVLVLGDPGYYQRFGFSVDAAHGLRTPFPPEHLMALALEPDAIDDLVGQVRYPAALAP